jgi:hypothetical protein
MRVPDAESVEMGKEDKIAPSNVQQISIDEDEFELQSKALSQCNDSFVTGYKTAESNISYLGMPYHDRYFQILRKQDEHVAYHHK